MIPFNEDNVTEQMCIEIAQQAGYTYIPADQLREDKSTVMVESLFKDAIMRMNPITEQEAAIVIEKVKARIMGGMSGDIVTANQNLQKLFFDQNSFPFDHDGTGFTNIKFFDENPKTARKNNSYVVTNQWEYPKSSYAGGKRLDIVLLINGLPMVIGEVKTATNVNVSWADGAKDICDYQKSLPEMFVPNILNFATEGRELYYAGIGTPLGKWGPWFATEERHHGLLKDVKENLLSLIDPLRLLEIYRFFSVYTTEKSSSKKIKIVCRYQQYYGGKAIVDRVMSRVETGIGPKKGLIWHFQGSGKSWLMVFASQMLMKKVPKAPTVVIVDDRRDLRAQITGDFTRAEIPNLDFAYTKEELQKFFKDDQRKILITTIFLFGDVKEALNARENIIVMVDEAHRTQEGDLGECMRTALPNAFFFGLTGTPINKRDKNTFRCFGAEEDEDRGSYMSKYSYQDSIDDGATLELNFKEVPVEMHLDEEKLQEAFDEMVRDNNLTDEERDELTRRTNVEAFFTDPKRIHEVCQHVAYHYRDYIKPTGLKCQLVVYNRACCVAYKKELDTLLDDGDETAIVMHTSGDKANEYAEYKLSDFEQEKLLNKFRDPLSPLKFVIVTSKLLTGFDAPILQCMYLDKPMKEHTLLQAICRTNRTYDAKKKCGLVVDYVGVFDDVYKALNFDEESIKHVIQNTEEIKAKIPEFIKDCLDFFPGVDRTIGGFAGLEAAQECLRDDKVKNNFAAHYMRLHKAWEVVSPDKDILIYKNDYTWLSQVYESVRPQGTSRNNLIWLTLGPKTIELIHENVTSIDIGDSLEDLVVDSHILDSCLKDEKKRNKAIIEIKKILILRLGNPEHKNDAKMKALSEKLKELQEKMRQNQIDSIDFLKQLLDIAKQVLERERELNQPEDKRKQAKAALTELFESIKTKDTPIAVEHAVNDIDHQVVDIIRRFPNAFKAVTGKQEIRKSLRSILWLKYKIKDNDVYEKACQYVEQYYPGVEIPSYEAPQEELLQAADSGLEIHIHIHMHDSNLTLSGNATIEGDVVENGGTKIVH